MATLAISDELYERLARMARTRHLPVERQAEELLAEAVDRSSRSEDLLRMADSIAAMTPKDVVQTDSTLLVREDRDR